MKEWVFWMFTDWTKMRKRGGTVELGKIGRRCIMGNKETHGSGNERLGKREVGKRGKEGVRGRFLW